MANGAVMQVTVPESEKGTHPEKNLPSLAVWQARDTGDFEKQTWLQEYHPSLEAVLNDLHERGLIEAGEYRIHAWW